MSQDKLLGRLAVHYKLITKDQLVEALAQQSRDGGTQRFGEILIEKGWISQGRFEQLLDIQAKYKSQLTQSESHEESEAPKSASSPQTTQPPAAQVKKPELDPTDIKSLLAYSADVGASDLHIHSGSPLRLRINGSLTAISEEILTPESSQRFVADVLTLDQQQQLKEIGELDFSYTLPGKARYRVNAYKQQRGTDAVFRVIPPKPPSLDDLGLPRDLARFCNHHQGMVLITGPSGCGKSSTLAALINILNEERRDHVITIEDPVEHVHHSQRSVINQRQVGPHTESFSRALRAALREDPDIIAVGELRDLETISLALTAAETGHLVLATLHTTNAVATINRVIGVFPPDQQNQVRTMVSESLRAIISQRLVPTADGSRRVPALEVLVCNRAVGNLIRDCKTFQIRSIMQTGASLGMRFLDASLKELVDEGTITTEEASNFADDPKLFSD